MFHGLAFLRRVADMRAASLWMLVTSAAIIPKQARILFLFFPSLSIGAPPTSAPGPATAGADSAGVQVMGSVVYNYIDFSAGAPRIEIAAINPNGTGDQFLGLALRNPAYPAWSRDGQLLAVAGNDPMRPFKWSTDVFTVDTANNQTTKITAFEDTAGASGFLTFYPSYLAFSRDRRHVVAGMVSYSGARRTIVDTNNTTDPYDTSSHVTRCVSLAVFNLDGSPGYLVASGLCDDTGHVGEGVDWSPVQDLIAYPYNVPTALSGGGQLALPTIQLIETTPNAADQGRRRQVTFPTGRTSGPFEPLSVGWESDFAPAFSPDGQRIAYVRLLTVSTAFELLPSLPTIRIVNVDGSNDHEIARFNQGDYITRISWSPDGTQLVFDLGRQALRDGFPLRTFDPASVTLARMNADGSGFASLRGASATWPTWRPATAVVTRPTLSARLVRDVPPVLFITWPTPVQSFVLESCPALGAAPNWQTDNTPVISNGGQDSVRVPLDSKARYFRLRLR